MNEDKRLIRDKIVAVDAGLVVFLDFSVAATVVDSAAAVVADDVVLVVAKIIGSKAVIKYLGEYASTLNNCCNNRFFVSETDSSPQNNGMFIS